MERWGWVVLDGVDDYIDVSSPQSLNPGTSSFTIECLIYQKDAGANGIVEARGTGLHGFLCILNYPSAGYLGFFLNTTNDGNQNIYNSSVATFSDVDRWMHVVVVVNRTAETITYYKNGIAQGTPSSVTSGGTIDPGSGYRYNIGGDLGGPEANANFSSYRQYNRILSSSEILQNYYQASIVTNGLVLAVDASNLASYPTSGTSWYDLTATANNGILVNGTAYETETGGTLVFDGTDDYVNVPYSASLAPTAALSFEAWAWKSNWNANQVNQRILSKTQNGGYQLSLNEGGLVPPGSIGVSVYLGGSYRSTSVLNSTIPGGWNHFAGTCDGRYVRFYVNGVNVSTFDLGSQSTISYSVNNSLLIGAEPGSGSTPDGQYFSGKIAAVRVYNRALSTAEIYSNFSAQSSRFGL